MSTVSHRISYQVVSSTRPGAAERGSLVFGFDTTESTTITADFGHRPDGEHIVWTFARDLLADGLTGLAGFGDITCWTRGVWYHIALSSPDGVAEFKCIAENVRAFLIDTEDLVPYGAEQIDIDAGIAQLLSGGRS